MADQWRTAVLRRNEGMIDQERLSNRAHDARVAPRGKIAPRDLATFLEKVNGVKVQIARTGGEV